jgi:hypothetical protein
MNSRQILESFIEQPLTSLINHFEGVQSSELEKIIAAAEVILKERTFNSSDIMGKL